MYSSSAWPAGGQPVEDSVLRRVLEGQDEVGVRGGRRVGREEGRAAVVAVASRRRDSPLQAPVLRGRSMGVASSAVSDLPKNILPAVVWRTDVTVMSIVAAYVPLGVVDHDHGAVVQVPDP